MAPNAVSDDAGKLPIDDGVHFQEAFTTNDRNMRQYVCSWLPADAEPRALIFLCHGYGMECSIFMHDTGRRLARAGYGVYGIDYEGHGKSSGKRCFIPSLSKLVADCTEYFMRIQDRKNYKGLPSFLYGESLGGAVAMLVSRRAPTRWNGMVLVAPMCKIAPKMKPHPTVISVLSKLATIIPTWKIVPGGDIYDQAFKLKEKREKIRANKLLYHSKPRVRTALEMYKASCDLEGRLHEVTLPFLVLHGEEDTVTEHAVSKALYDQAKSFDKEFKLYPGFWHGLTVAEADQDIDLVFADIIHWLDERSPPHNPTNSPAKPKLKLNKTNYLPKSSLRMGWEGCSSLYRLSNRTICRPRQILKHASTKVSAMAG